MQPMYQVSLKNYEENSLFKVLCRRLNEFEQMADS